MRDGGKERLTRGRRVSASLPQLASSYSIVPGVVVAIKDASGIGLGGASGSERVCFRHRDLDDFGKTFLEKGLVASVFPPSG